VVATPGLAGAPGAGFAGALARVEPGLAGAGRDFRDKLLNSGLSWCMKESSNLQ
jgi:hypothetical protein